ncbi:hypothetical protein [Streptomyces sp. NBC_00893]|uniref:hypothetical protein n=1 Tax=Streptomyces sp. NBC_00893 TaxID=2975862 RepID=UPI00224D8877|nr:hypothetical protein [Streptomyces sp. NBC_00893]MCX4848276.1 hypothetical protein [Streptomyces sp. NBC_00893]
MTEVPRPVPEPGKTSRADARQWEYTTFAPSGETCPACLKPIAPLERCRRGEIERAPGSPVTFYRHVDCENPQGLRRRPRR